MVMHGENLRLTATDLELGITAECPVDEVRENGDFAISAIKLNEIVGSVEEGAIDFIAVEEVAEIRAGRARWRIGGIEGSEYPTLPDFSQSGQVWALPREEMIVILRRLKGTVAPESDLRAGLHGIGVEADRIMSSDGEALTIQRVEYSVGNVRQIPGGCVNNLLKVLLLSEEKEVILTQTDEHLFIHVGDDEFFTRLLDNWEFPDVQALIDEVGREPVHCVVERSDLLLSVKRVKVTTNEERQDITIRLQENIRLGSRNLAGDLAVDEVTCRRNPDVDASPRTFKVSWQRLAHALQSAQTARIAIKVSGGAVSILDPGIHLTTILMKRRVETGVKAKKKSKAKRKK